MCAGQIGHIIFLQLFVPNDSAFALLSTRTKVRQFLIYLYSKKAAYLQLITVLVYGNSSPKGHEQGYLNF